MSRTQQTVSSKKGEMKDIVADIEEIGGRVTNKRARELIYEQTGIEVSVTQLNYLAYEQKIDTKKIGGVFLFLKEGDNSIMNYLPILQEKISKKDERASNADKAKIKKEANTLLKQLVEESLKKHGTVDIEAIRQHLGL